MATPAREIFKAQPDSDAWSYLGWQHVTEECTDSGRITHFAVRGGERRVLHWSPFKPYTEQHFRRYIDLGFPPAATGNYFPDEIDALWSSWSAAA